LLIALKNLIDRQLANRRLALREQPVRGSKRVRVTGAVS